MELRQLRAFCEVARLRHFTQAAERLGYTQPTVTGQIQLLEDELGVKLFERLGRQVILTAADEQLRPYAEQILQLSATATALFQQDVEPHGPLRLGIGESLASLLLAPLLQTYIRPSNWSCVPVPAAISSKDCAPIISMSHCCSVPH